MTLAYSDFIAGFPEFTDSTKYPVATFNFWAAQANDNVGWARRMTLGQQTLAQCLFVAHNVALAAKAAAEAAIGAIPGQVTGALTSKSIDKVSTGYNPTSTIEGAGPWNLTTYGQRYYQMLQGINTAVYVPGRGSYRGNPYGGPFGPYGRPC
jgi:hypothetical protein